MKIFISYRRQDSQWVARALNKELEKRIGEKNVFMDKADIRPTDDFTQSIESNLLASDIVLVLIGKEWLTCRDDEGNQRLFKPGDYLRQEIEYALKFNKKILPVLIDETTMPAAGLLPASITELHKKQCMRISNDDVDMHIFNLINELYRISGEKNPYSDLIRDFASGKISEKELVKPDSNSAYSYICLAAGIFALLISDGIVAVQVLAGVIILAGGYGWFLSYRVKPLWLEKRFDTARSAAKRAKYVSLITPGIGGLLIIIVLLLHSFGKFGEAIIDQKKTEPIVTFDSSAISGGGSKQPSSTPVQAQTVHDQTQQSGQGYVTISTTDYSLMLSQMGASASVYLIIGGETYQLTGNDLTISILQPGMVAYTIRGTTYWNGQTVCNNNTSGQINLTAGATYYFFEKISAQQSGQCNWQLFTESQYLQEKDLLMRNLQQAFQ